MKQIFTLKWLVDIRIGVCFICVTGHSPPEEVLAFKTYILYGSEDQLHDMCFTVKFFKPMNGVQGYAMLLKKKTSFYIYQKRVSGPLLTFLSVYFMYFSRHCLWSLSDEYEIPKTNITTVWIYYFWTILWNQSSFHLCFKQFQIPDTIKNTTPFIFFAKHTSAAVMKILLKVNTSLTLIFIFTNCHLYLCSFYL